MAKESSLMINQPNKKPAHLFSLVIPVYRQDKIIRHNLRHIAEFLQSIQYPYEIIAVIDGMIDNSFQEAKLSQVKNLRIIAYKRNHGKSFAIRTGMHYASGDYVMFLDSGNDIDPEAISILLGYMTLHDADIVVGSKRHPDSRVHYSWDRKIFSYGYYFLVQLLFQLKIRDTQAGIKVFRKHVLEEILPKLMEKKFAGDLEMIIAARRNGFKKIHEAPIKLNYSLGGISSAANLSSIFRIAVDTMAIFYRNFIVNHYGNHNKSRYKPPQGMIFYRI